MLEELQMVKKQVMNYENNKLSLAECRKAVAKGKIIYTDEELIKIRDWLDNMADIILTIIEKMELIV